MQELHGKQDRKPKLIIDTNFMLIPYQFHVDIFSEFERVVERPFELYITSGTIAELEKLLHSTEQKERLAARLALEFVNKMASKGLKSLFLGLRDGEKQKNLKIAQISSTQHNDDAIVRLASSDDIVATQDKSLIKRLKEKNIKIARLKQGKYLIVE